MKREVLLFVAVLVGGDSLQGQGRVWFSNVGTGTSISNILTAAPVPAGTSFQAALYFLPDSQITPTTADFDRDGVVLLPNAAGFQVPGQFSAGTRTTPPGSDPGTFGWFQVRAWEAAFGSSYEQARDNPNPQGGRLACLGTSNIIRIGPLAGGPGPDPRLVPFGLMGFYVCVPEPPVLILAILGTFFLLLSTRR